MDLTDIVFEGRNKDYGAYYLKKKYVRYLLVSFSITILVVLFFVGYSIAFEFLSYKSVPIPRGVVYEPTPINLEDIKIPELPEPEPIKEDASTKLNDVPVISDSVKRAAPKEVIPEEEKKVEEEEQDSSGGGAPQGLANGEITIPIQRMPQFPGGQNALAAYMQRNIRYNLISKSKIKGMVVISFVVKKDGRVGDVKVVQSLAPEIDQECVRVVSSMPLWSPAISGGRPIEIVHNLPFTF